MEGLNGLETRLREELASKADVGILKAGIRHLDEKFDRMAADQVRMRENMATKEDFRTLHDDFERIYRTALESAEIRARCTTIRPSPTPTSLKGMWRSSRTTESGSPRWSPPTRAAETVRLHLMDS